MTLAELLFRNITPIAVTIAKVKNKTGNSLPHTLAPHSKASREKCVYYACVQLKDLRGHVHRRPSFRLWIQTVKKHSVSLRSGCLQYS